MDHTVSIENTFQGPLDLLLYLVKRDEIDIHDIPIAHLTREYVAELDKLTELDVDVASEFLAWASMLIEIKSRMLLPPVEAEGESEEESEVLDPRQGLVQALLEYKRFKEAAAMLGDMAEEHARRFARIAPLPAKDEDATIEDANAFDLLVAFQKMIRNLNTTAQKIVSDEVPTEVRMDLIRERSLREDHFTFSSLLSDAPTRGEMVGLFIALLELIRLGHVLAEQSSDYAEIYILRRRESSAKKSGRIMVRTQFRQGGKSGATRLVGGLFSPVARTLQTADVCGKPNAFPPVVCRGVPTEAIAACGKAFSFPPSIRRIGAVASPASVSSLFSTMPRRTSGAVKKPVTAPSPNAGTTANANRSKPVCAARPTKPVGCGTGAAEEGTASMPRHRGAEGYAFPPVVCRRVPAEAAAACGKAFSFPPSIRRIGAVASPASVFSLFSTMARRTSGTVKKPVTAPTPNANACKPVCAVRPAKPVECGSKAVEGSAAPMPQRRGGEGFAFPPAAGAAPSCEKSVVTPAKPFLSSGVQKAVQPTRARTTFPGAERMR